MPKTKGGKPPCQDRHGAVGFVARHKSIPSAPAHQLGAGGSGTNAQKLLGGRTGGAEAWCNHAAG